MKALAIFPGWGLALAILAGCGRSETTFTGASNAIGLANHPGNPAERGKKEKVDDEGKFLDRKIKYTADIRLITDDFAKGEETLKELVKVHKGYTANSEITGAPGTFRTGTWKVRVPVKEFDGFREGVLKIADVEKNSSDSEDVTAEYYDLESNIKNELAEEESLRKLLDRVADKEKMENILAIRRELTEVRGKIQTKQGRLKLLQNLTNLTTVNVTLREREKYDAEKKPKRVETPTFGQRIGRTFEDSWEILTGAGQWLVLILVGMAPWSPLIVIGALVLWWTRRQNRVQMITPSHQQPPPTAVPLEPPGPQ